MNQNTKQRVVGTLVLLAVALIFLPVIFDGEGSYQRPVSSRIPDPPLVPVLEVPQATRVTLQGGDLDLVSPAPDVSADVALDSAVPLIEEAAPNATVVVTEPEVEADPATVIAGATQAQAEADSNAAAPELSFDEQGLPIGWSVRLATFSNFSNASNLRDKLVAAGYRSYSREVRNSNGETMTVVFVGPQQDREKVEVLRQELQTEFQLRGNIVRFEVEAL